MTLIQIKVVIADDHDIVREGLKNLLQKSSNIKVVGEAENGVDTLKLVKSVFPDVVILDNMMPGIDGLEVIRQTHQFAPHIKCILLTMLSDEVYIRRAFKLGASGYILKDSTSTEMLPAIEAVLAGEKFISASLAEKAVDAIEGRVAEDEDPLETLTPREREVLLLTVRDYTTSMVADALEISRRTVESHRQNMMNKLGLSTRGQLVRYAINRRLIETDQDGNVMGEGKQ